MLLSWERREQVRIGNGPGKIITGGEIWFPVIARLDPPRICHVTPYPMPAKHLE